MISSKSILRGTFILLSFSGVAQAQYSDPSMTANALMMANPSLFVPVPTNSPSPPSPPMVIVNTLPTSTPMPTALPTITPTPVLYQPPVVDESENESPELTNEEYIEIIENLNEIPSVAIFEGPIWWNPNVDSHDIELRANCQLIHGFITSILASIDLNQARIVVLNASLTKLNNDLAPLKVQHVNTIAARNAYNPGEEGYRIWNDIVMTEQMKITGIEMNINNIKMQIKELEETIALQQTAVFKNQVLFNLRNCGYGPV